MDAKIDWLAYLNEQSRKVKRPSIKAFYASQLFDPELTISDADYVAIDFETTGLDAESNEIVSIGLVPFDLNRIYFNKAKEWFVKPRRSLSHDSVTIHGITHSQLSDAPDISEVLGEVLEAAAGRVVVVHFKYIERNFLYNAVKDRTGEQLMFPVIDTMSLEDQLHRRGLLSRMKQHLFGKRESVRLADSRERYGLPRYQLHSAKVDALATAELLQAQLKNFYPDDTRISHLWE